MAYRKECDKILKDLAKHIEDSQFNRNLLTYAHAEHLDNYFSKSIFKVFRKKNTHMDTKKWRIAVLILLKNNHVYLIDKAHGLTDTSQFALTVEGLAYISDTSYVKERYKDMLNRKILVWTFIVAMVGLISSLISLFISDEFHKVRTWILSILQ